MMKKKLILCSLLGGLIIVSAAIVLNSCKKDNEANEDLNLPTIEIVLNGDTGQCPYCGEVIEIGQNHVHYFSPMQEETRHSGQLTWGSMYMTNETGEDVPNNLGNIEHPFPVDFCETYLDLPLGTHVCRYATEHICHRHIVCYKNGYDDNTDRSWHIGGGLEP